MKYDKIRKPEEVIAFWLAAGSAKWFAYDEAFDAQIIELFTTTNSAAREGKCSDWQNNSADMLALILVLDQFSRNIFRGSPLSFQNDPMALELAQQAVKKKLDLQLDEKNNSLKMFFYLPFMHSENLAMQEECLRLMSKAKLGGSVSHAGEHRDTIREFGRFPHRNAVLGRKSTKAELDFLARGGLAPQQNKTS